jgi:lysyl-tRNA synthetase class I
MTDGDLPHKWTFESRDPIQHGRAFCSECGRRFEVVTTGGDLAGVQLQCACGEQLWLDIDTEDS